MPKSSMRMKRTLLGYLPIESPMHSFHPLIKTLFLLIVSAYPLLIDPPEWNLIGALAMIALFVLSKVQLRILKYYTTIMLNIFWIIFIAYTFFGGYAPGYHIITRVGPIIVSWENLVMVFVIYLRMFFAILVIIFFLSVARERDVIVGIETLHIPYILAYTIGLAFRSIGLSIIDFSTIREAEKARALDLKALPLIQKIKKFGMYIVPLVALALRRADEVSNALESRGFSFKGLKGYKRTNYIVSKYRFRIRDYIAITCMISILIVILYFKYFTQYFSLENSFLLRILSSILGVGV